MEKEKRDKDREWKRGIKIEKGKKMENIGKENREKIEKGKEKKDKDKEEKEKE